MTSTIGIPIKLLNEAAVRVLLYPTLVAANRSQGHVVTLEISNGQVYRGKLLEGTCL
jgi:small nuclear ribonucleoprotein D3